MSLARIVGSTVLATVILAWGPAVATESPHWNKATCDACHSDASPAQGRVALRHVTPEEGCSECHGGGGKPACRHRSGLPIGDMTVPDYYRAELLDGKITCTTCHAVTFQCNNPNIAYSLQNPGFLRNRVSHDSADQCFECHDEQQYAALNPHKGTIKESPRPTCLLCHERVPQSTASGGIDVSFNMRHDLNDMCRGCHDLRPHPRGMSFGTEPEGWVHLAKPSTEVLGKMQRWEAATGMKLPLSPYNGEIYCATCHNPHEFEGGPVAQQREYRLWTDDICQVCHDK